jgi:hypothetical protein
MISHHLKFDLFNFEIVGLTPTQDFSDDRWLEGLSIWDSQMGAV